MLSWDLNAELLSMMVVRYLLSMPVMCPVAYSKGLKGYALPHGSCKKYARKKMAKLGVLYNFMASPTQFLDLATGNFAQENQRT